MPAIETFVGSGWHLEDFNQNAIADEPLAHEPLEEGNNTVEVAVQDDWTDGYIHASRSLAVRQPDEALNTALINVLQGIEARLITSVENSALLLARLLLEAMAAHGHERWAGLVQDHIQHIADIVRPALLSTMPQISVQSRDGESLTVSATSCTDNAEGSAKLADHITLCWHLGKAEAGWSKTLRETAKALAPLILDSNLQAMEAA